MASKSSVKGGTRHTSRHDGGSRDETYRNGTMVSIDDHTKDGKAHSHKVCRNIFGPYAGEIIKKKK